MHNLKSTRDTNVHIVYKFISLDELKPGKGVSPQYLSIHIT